MILSIYRTPKFRKKLNSLLSSGGIAALAATRADEIIEIIARKGDDALEHTSKLTRHGEHRIRNCRKYDLGQGYRMICLSKDCVLTFLYIGTHDESDRWLHRNRNIDIDDFEVGGDVPPEAPLESKEQSMEEESEPDMGYDDLLLENVDDKDLRSIFSGLCEK
jgi:hypothetical protein